MPLVVGAVGAAAGKRPPRAGAGAVVWCGHQPGLLDFDDCGWGHFAYDLAPVVGNLMDYRTYPRLRAALLEGYRSVFDLAPAHEALLETLVAARHAASCLWAAGNARHGGGLTAQEAQAHLAHRLGEVRRVIQGTERGAEPGCAALATSPGRGRGSYSDG